jgi:predicted transcriptional regulator
MAIALKELETLLLKLGFGPKEVDVYLSIQKHGKVTPAQLAQITGINRTTVYSIAKELIKRDVITEDLGGKQRFLIASPPESLAGTVRREQKALDEKKEVVNQAMSAIKEVVKNAEYIIPKIQFITEDKIEDFLYSRTPEWDKSIMETDGTYLGFQEPAFAKQYAKWIKWYWSRHPKKIKFNLLSNDSEAEQHVASSVTPERKITFWKDSVKFTATTWVMGDYVVMFVLSSKPKYLVEIHDKVFAQNQRELFRGILEDIEK